MPLALTGQTLSVWMKEAGVSLAAIGFFSLVGLPYVWKFVWAPLIDAVSIPWLTPRLGRRRSWLLVTQILLIAATLALGTVDPLAAPAVTAALAVLVAFTSASQDIVVDAFRIESLDKPQQAAGMSNYVLGYRVALLVATAGAFEVASLAQGAGFAGNAGWMITYAAMAALIGVGVLATLMSREPEAPPALEAQPFRARLRASTVDPLRDFAGRREWLLILLFIVAFKVGDAMAGVMTAPFVLDLGFDKTDHGRVVKLFGFVATILGGIAGGVLHKALGATGALWIAGIAQAVSNLLFVWLAGQGADHTALAITIGGENFASGLGTVVFVAYLSALCGERAYTATQFALLSALSAVPRTILSSFGGVFAEWFGWADFFLITTVAAVPGLILLAWLSRRAARSSSDLA